MELLVILLGEFLFFPVIAALGVFVNLTVGFLGLILELCSCRGLSTGKGKSRSLTPPVAGSGKRFPIKEVTRIAAVLFLITLGFLFAVNTFLFEPTVRFIVAKIEAKTKIEIAFSSASGDVFSGVMRLENLHVQRAGHHKLDFDISARRVNLNIDIWGLLSHPILIDDLVIDGVKGEIWDKAKQEDVSQEKPENKFEAALGDFKFGIKSTDDEDTANEIPPQKLKAKKSFVIKNLLVNNVALDVHKNDKEPLSLVLAEIQSAPFRSEYAVFDTFFRSNIEGSLNNHKLKISTEEISDGRKTKWQLENFPVSLVSTYVHKTPFSWFKSGAIDILVEDEWQYGENAEIAMDWSMQLKGVVVEAPENASVVSKAIAYPIVNYINTREDDVGLLFSLVMNERQFESTSSLDAAGLWDAVIQALSKKMADMTGGKKEEIKQSVENGIQGFKNFLNKKRE